MALKSEDLNSYHQTFLYPLFVWPAQRQYIVRIDRVRLHFVEKNSEKYIWKENLDNKSLRDAMSTDCHSKNMRACHLMCEFKRIFKFKFQYFPNFPCNFWASMIFIMKRSKLIAKYDLETDKLHVHSVKHRHSPKNILLCSKCNKHETIKNRHHISTHYGLIDKLKITGANGWIIAMLVKFRWSGSSNS